MSATPRSRLTHRPMSQNSSRTPRRGGCESLWKSGTTPVHCQVALVSLWRDIPSWGTPYPPRRCWGPVATTAPSRKRSKRLCQSGSRLGENAPWVGHRPGRIIFDRTFLPPLLLVHFLHAGHVTVAGTGLLTQRARGIQLWKTLNQLREGRICENPRTANIIEPQKVRIFLVDLT